jgi:hypothetical protein
VLGVVVCLLFLSCASSRRQYPTAAVRPLELNMQFKPLLTAPEAYKGRIIHLAGEIVEIKSSNEEGGIVLEAQRLWLAEHPEYPGFRPLELGDDPHDMFVLWYPERLDPEAMRIGNKFVAVTRIVTSPKAKQMKLLVFRAHCVHVWKTGEKKIAFFKDRYTQVYAPLEQETYCTEDGLAEVAQATEAFRAGAPSAGEPAREAPAEVSGPAALSQPQPASPRASQSPRFAEGQRVRAIGVVTLTADAAGTKFGPAVGPEIPLTVVDGEVQGDTWVYLVAQPKTNLRGWIPESQLTPVSK